jgi:hypothetical protein
MSEREQQEAEAFIRWRDLSVARLPMLSNLFHIPNGGKRHVVVGVKLKRAGLRKGVVDYFLAFVAPGFAGLWLEMKTDEKDSGLSREQIRFLADMRAAGYAVAVAIGWEHATRIVETYITGGHVNDAKLFRSPVAANEKNAARNRDILGHPIGRI